MPNKKQPLNVHTYHFFWITVRSGQLAHTSTNPNGRLPIYRACLGQSRWHWYKLRTQPNRTEISFLDSWHNSRVQHFYDKYNRLT